MDALTINNTVIIICCSIIRGLCSFLTADTDTSCIGSRRK